MEIGISLASSTRTPGRAAGRHLVELARLAADAGLVSLTLGDHHVVGPPGGYFQNTPTLGRLLADWSPTGRPAGCLFLLPQWVPMLVAEQIGTLANLHDGPFIVQTGLGWGPPAEFEAMGASPHRRVLVYDEAMRVVRALLAGETVSSEHFGFEDASIGLVPEYPVDWWVGTGNPAGVVRAAKAGAAWYAGPGVMPDGYRSIDATYREACAEHGTEPRVMLRRDALVLRDGERARRTVEDAAGRGYRGLHADMLLAGDPTQVAEQLSVWHELGVDQIVTRTMGLSDDDDLTTVELLGEVQALLA